MTKLESIKKHGRKAIGRTELVKHLNGEKLTMKGALKANCYNCTGYFADGPVDCKMEDCPLHPFMAYNPVKSRIRKERVFKEKEAA